LLVEAEVVERRRRRPPRLRQRPVPNRWRRRAPTPRRQAVAPRGAVKTSAPVVVLRAERRSPIVTAGTVEVAGRWAARTIAGSAEVTGRTAGRVTPEVAGRTTGGTAPVPGRAAPVAGRRPVRTAIPWRSAAGRATRSAAPIRALHPRRALRRGVGDARTQRDARRAEHATDGRSR
jgi:hypothetical protein